MVLDHQLLRGNRKTRVLDVRVVFSVRFVGVQGISSPAHRPGSEGEILTPALYILSRCSGQFEAVYADYTYKYSSEPFSSLAEYLKLVIERRPTENTEKERT